MAILSNVLCNFISIFHFRKDCKILKVIPPQKPSNVTNGMDVSDSDSDCICLDDPEPVQSAATSPKYIYFISRTVIYCT